MHEDRKAQLETRRAELLQRMQEVDEELGSHDSKDWEEAAIERETDEVLEQLGASSQEELRRIDAALERITTGDYGYCGHCGSEIAPKRLDLLPFTPFCQNCAP